MLQGQEAVRSPKNSLSHRLWNTFCQDQELAFIGIECLDKPVDQGVGC
jgi:hypothetical protein